MQHRSMLLFTIVASLLAALSNAWSINGHLFGKPNHYIFRCIQRCPIHSQAPILNGFDHHLILLKGQYYYFRNHQYTSQILSDSPVALLTLLFSFPVSNIAQNVL